MQMEKEIPPKIIRHQKSMQLKKYQKKIVDNNKEIFYLIKWKYFNFSTWEPAECIEDSMLKYFGFSPSKK